ncbi:kinase-like protein [Lentithecium fluviatile CBS 122367]|uniref:Kinase-like protein n=1 Tax=Lentithecium fluviatile CBS 122367 TaxID=1168545 RepID=A0A6G1J982_9PLEO|nr:kinase-like protein [Lentithecium fluviatile CBS 122367]
MTQRPSFVAPLPRPTPPPFPMLPLAPSPTYVDDFLKYINSAEVLAIDPSSPQERRAFVPEDDLHGYLSESTIRRLLSCYNLSATECTSIRGDYLIVFTILIYIGKGIHIAQFLAHERLSDRFLPLLNDHDLPHGCKDFFDRFYEAQWRFCAQRLRIGRLNDTQLDDRRIIPILESEALHEGPDSCTYKVKVHPSYNQLLEKIEPDATTTDTFVLKTCPARNDHHHYDEVQAYKDMRTEHDVMSNMVRFFGSWKQGHTYYMLLEYADGGTLESFLQDTAPPTKREHIIMFWERMFDLIKLIARIHKHPNPNRRHEYLQGIHHDIKPPNILVSRKRNPASKYDVIFKLADFGMADFVHPGHKEGELQRRDMNGTQMYSAPECYRNETNSTSMHMIREGAPSKDIWSTGCVFSEAAVWSVLGKDGLHEYHDERTAATDKLPGFRSTADSGCFHDGEKLLEAVIDMHRRLRQERRRTDPLIDDIVNIVEDMLEDSGKRPDAQRVYERFSNRVLPNAKANAEFSTNQSNRSQWPPAFRVPSDTASGRPLPPELPPEHSALGITYDPTTPQSMGFSPVLPIDNGLSFHPPLLPTFNGDRRPYSTPGPTLKYRAHANQGSEALEPLGDALPNGSPPHSCLTRPMSYPCPGNIETTQYPSRKPKANGATSLLGSLTIPKESLNRSASKSPTLSSEPSKSHAPREEFPEATIDQVEAWMNDTKQNPSTASLRGLEYLKRLNGRDHIFLFDDSSSMKSHWKESTRTFETLAYLVKTKDPDGMEIRFTSDPSLKHHHKDRKPLIRYLNKTTPSGVWDIGCTLGEILREYNWAFSDEQKGLSSLWRKKRKQKWGVNIYVFTNGVWAEGQNWLSDVVDSIKTLLKKGVQPRQIGIQFIQFGEDLEGTERLRILDDELQEHGVPKDIVDTERHNGNVFKMLLGSMDRTWDEHHPKSSQSHTLNGQLPASTPRTSARPVS